MIEHSEEELRCGLVSIVGRPNVGKSTLVNKILGEKVAIVSPIPQTTRTQIRGVYNDERGQIVFIDTPGLHLGGDQLDRFMNEMSTSSLDGVDCIIHLVDTTRHVGEEEHNVIQRLAHIKTPIILGLNKVDVRRGPYLDEYIALWEEIAGKPINDLSHITVLPLSSHNDLNIDKLLDVVFEQLPITHPYYERDVISDVPHRVAVADLIREKLLLVMRDEVPHSIGILLDEMRPKRGKTYVVRATIYVERDSQKEIVIGKDGHILKKAGSAARRDLEDLFGCKVFLDLFVKVDKDWRRNSSVLNEMGYEL